jgi:ATP-binding cassette subfamily F protein 3
MLFVNGLSMQFSGEYLFDEVSFMVNDRDRIGLVGANGAGKSTLLKILVGETEAESGTIEKSNEFRIGYLPQDGLKYSGRTLIDEARSAWPVLVDVDEETWRVQRLIEEHTNHASEEYLDLVNRLGELHHRFEELGGYAADARIASVMSGLGFTAGDLLRLTDEFSGGWQMRIALGKLLLQQPDLLLLDEPTNHLDIESLTWLETWLQSYEGALIIVSHDRHFLDAITIRTIEIAAGDVYMYEGNYSTFVIRQQERRALMKGAYENQQRRVAEIERFIERFRYKATKSRQVQSRVKMLDRMERVEVEEEDRSRIRFTFPIAPPGGAVPLEVKDGTKYYDSLLVFEAADLQIERGDRIAFLGRNGEGKSTMAKILAGVEPLTRGECVVGYNVVRAYYAQQQADALDPNKTVLETVDQIATGEQRGQLRSLLGAFLFQGDDVFKKVKVLSGGEKARLALAKMLLVPANVLIMDEPTNHLDMRSKTQVKEALQKFKGTIIVVSHDRDFLDGLVSKVVEFKDHAIKIYPGSVEEWLLRRGNTSVEAATAKKVQSLKQVKPARKEKESSPAVAHVKPAGTAKPSHHARHAENEARNARSKRLKTLKERVTKLEKEIAAQEAKKVEIEDTLAHSEIYRDGEQAKKLNESYRMVGVALSELYFKWGEANEALERG